jgi:hypothetical protein
MSGQNQSSVAVWSGVPAHTFSIAESLPGGYGEPIVICGGQRLDVSNAAVHPTLNEGESLSCDWFNVQSHSLPRTLFQRTIPSYA